MTRDDLPTLSLELVMLAPRAAFAPVLCAYTAELMPTSDKIRALQAALAQHAI